MTDSTKAYKIRRTSDGLFSTGGATPKFNRVGKTWSHIGHVKSHLTLLDHNARWSRGRLKPASAIYADCEVVTLETQVTATVASSIDQLINS